MYAKLHKTGTKEQKASDFQERALNFNNACLRVQVVLKNKGQPNSDFQTCQNCTNPIFTLYTAFPSIFCTCFSTLLSFSYQNKKRDIGSSLLHSNVKIRDESK